MSVSESAILTYGPITDDLIPTLLNIEHEAYPEPWSEGMFRDEIYNPRSHFFIAYKDDELIGYGGFWLVVDEAHITSVTVRHEQRGRKYGEQLLVHLLDDAAASGARIATLEVRPSNIAARELYRKFGFRAVGVRKNYYVTSKEDALIMTKDIEQPPEPI